MIKHWIITGDTHCRVEDRLAEIEANMSSYNPTETAVIILGDAGLNFWLGGSDKKHKRESAKFGYTIYCVHGNHEERPENLGYTSMYDPNVDGEVYFDPDFDNIRYFWMSGEYMIGGRKTLVIGGAYSVDKWYRLNRAAAAGQSFSGWFESEQLTEAERQIIWKNVVGQTYNLVLTHTCPLDWEPTDLFLSGIDQSTVDKSMEVWLNNLKETFVWDYWLFGHYHADRIERPYVEQFYREFEDLEDIIQRWQKYDLEGKLDWWLPCSPYMEAEKWKA